MSTHSAPKFLQPAGDPSDEDGLFRWMRRFLQHNRNNGYTDQTLNDQERYIRDFIRWCDSRQLSKLDAIGIDELQADLLYLHTYRTRLGRPLAWNSKNSKLVSVRSFFRWLQAEGRLERDPAAKIKLSQRPSPLLRSVPTEADVEKILRQPDITTPLGLRDRAMLELFFGTGIRRMELAGLRISDLDLEGKTIHVHQGKGGKQRLVPVADETLFWIKRYLDDVRGRTDGTPFLFLTRNGEPFNLSWLTTVIGTYIHAVMPDQAGACHLLRHSMATSMLEHGADIRHIQVILGHSELTSTQIYTHVSLNQLRAVYDRTHPSARKSGQKQQLLLRDHLADLAGSEFHQHALALLLRLPIGSTWVDLIHYASAMAVADNVATVSSEVAAVSAEM